MDKALLEVPLDEFDYSKVPIKDLILLAEHKERLAVCFFFFFFLFAINLLIRGKIKMIFCYFDSHP